MIDRKLEPPRRDYAPPKDIERPAGELRLPGPNGYLMTAAGIPDLPFVPVLGDGWLDVDTGRLYKFDGEHWVPDPP